MSLDIAFWMRLLSLRAQGRVLNLAGCSEGTITALEGNLLVLDTLPTELSAAYRSQQLATTSALAARGLAPNGDAESALVSALALQQTLGSSPLGAVAEDLHTAQLHEARTLLTTAETRLAVGDAAGAESLAAGAYQTLVDTTVDSYERLRVAGNLVARDDLVATVASLGFETHTFADEAGNHALWARHGDEQIAALVSGAGAVEVDLQGHEGTSCVAIQTAIAEALRARGWSIEVIDTVLHQRRAGGALITEAARLARERGCSPQEALLMTKSPAASRASDGRERLRRALLSRARVRQRIS